MALQNEIVTLGANVIQVLVAAQCYRILKFLEVLFYFKFLKVTTSLCLPSIDLDLTPYPMLNIGFIANGVKMCPMAYA